MMLSISINYLFHCIIVPLVSHKYIDQAFLFFAMQRHKMNTHKGAGKKGEVSRGIEEIPLSLFKGTFHIFKILPKALWEQWT